MKWAQLYDSINILLHYLSLGLEWKLTFPVLWPVLSFPNLLANWVQHFLSLIFRIWISSTGIPSPPPALFVVMLPKAHLASQSRLTKIYSLHQGSLWGSSILWIWTNTQCLVSSRTVSHGVVSLPWTSPVHHLCIFPSLEPLADIDLSINIAYIVLPFPECHIVGIILYVALAD